MLPLFRLAPRLPPAALVVGSCVPDVAYLLGIGGWASHTGAGLLTFCLPAGLVALVWLERLVLPALSRTLPPVAGVDLARQLRPRGLPAGPRGWMWASLAILVGAALHLLWDGFTHPAQWPARVLYPDVFLEVGSRRFPLARVFQHLSTVAGSMVVLAWLVRRQKRLPRAAAPEPGRWIAIAVPISAGLLGGLVWRLVHPIHTGSMEADAWYLFWPLARGAVLGLTAGALALRLRERSEDD